VQPLDQAAASTFRKVRFVLTDMDETLTYKGRLSAETYLALERLQAAGVTVIPVTGAPAGWCDQMARMWPVDGVIGENGGLFFRRDGGGHGLKRYYWHKAEERVPLWERLKVIGARVCEAVPSATFAEDQLFRQASLAFNRSQDVSEQEAIRTILRAHGADSTVNNLWVLGWLGGFDKLTMARRVLREHFDLDVDVDRDAVLYSGDSANDAPMFSFFEHTVGVSTVKNYLDQIPTPPKWITRGPGGTGFVEAADAVIASRRT